MTEDAGRSLYRLTDDGESAGCVVSTRTEFYQSPEDGDWYWRALARVRGQAGAPRDEGVSVIVSRSSEGYESRAGAERGAVATLRAMLDLVLLSDWSRPVIMARDGERWTVRSPHNREELAVGVKPSTYHHQARQEIALTVRALTRWVTERRSE